MPKPHRIAAGALVFKHEKILLVRYPAENGSTFLVGPGGGLEDNETLWQAVIRETREETGIHVTPLRLALVEDAIPSDRFTSCKIWILCRYLAGEIHTTPESDAEAILEANWYSRDQLAQETVYPSPLQQVSWNLLQSESWTVQYLTRS